MAVRRDELWFEHLARLLDLERKAQKETWEEQRRTLPLGELEKRGLVLLDLESTDEDVGLGGRFLVTLERADKRPFSTRFSPGDLVSLRPRRSEDEAPAQAIVSNARHGRVQLAFDKHPP